MPSLNFHRALIWTTGHKFRDLQRRGFPGLRSDARTASGELMDKVALSLAVGRAVVTEDLVKPDGGLREDIRMLPGVPGEIRLGLSGDESPINGRHV